MKYFEQYVEKRKRKKGQTSDDRSVDTANFNSYLQERSQRVVLKNSSSPLGKISAGIPQGSVLGPYYLLSLLTI